MDTRKTVLGAIALLLAAPAGATEFRATAGVWRYDIGGTVTDRGQTYDLQEELEMQPSGRRSWAIEWDTPKGPLPDLALAYGRIGATGYHEETVTIFPLPPQTETIEASADFDDYELTARYPFGTGAFRVALGVTVKKFDGEVLIDDSTNPPASRQQYDETVPLAHGQLRIALGKRLAFVATAQGASAGGSSASEWRALAQLRLEPLIVEGGWQEKRYELNLDGRALDARLDGGLLRIGYLWSGGPTPPAAPAP